MICTPCQILIQIIKNEMGDAGMEKRRVLVGKPKAKRPLGRHRHRWEDNIKLDLQEIGGGHGLD
jgi:hypothetical protein